MRNDPNTRLRVVLDTNVYISAFVFPNGVADQVFQQAKQRSFHLLVSPAIVNETAKKLREKFGQKDLEVIPNLKLITHIAEIIQPTINLKVVVDEPDNRILECAVEGKVHLIVTGDHKHLLPLNPFQGIGIITPIDFLRTLGVTTSP